MGGQGRLKRLATAGDPLPAARESLALDFGPGSEAARRTVRAFYEALASGRYLEASTAIDTWRRLTGGGWSDARRTQAGLVGLGQAYGVPPAELQPGEMLLAVQSYFALVVRLLATQAVCGGAGVARHGHQPHALSAPWPFMPLEPPNDPFSWYLAARSEPIERALGQLHQLAARYEPAWLTGIVRGGHDLFQELYQGIVPRRVRHALGEYYTPEWLAEQMLDEVGYQGTPGERLLDPACGSGTLLILAIRRLRTQCSPGAEDLGRSISASVVGLDRNPLAVLTARANYLIAVADLVGGSQPLDVPVHLADSILAAETGGHRRLGRFEYVVGNPPWIAWDDLPADYREATKPLWRQYGLFSLSAGDARHGGGKKDLSMLMTYAAADRFLTDAGRLALVITQTLFQTKGAGDGFRRFRLGEGGAWLQVLGVNDLVDLRPFPSAANWTATIVLQKGHPTTYPVRYVRWSRGEGSLEDRRVEASEETRGHAPAGTFRRVYQARPIDPHRPTSPWFLWPDGWQGPTDALIGPADYRAHLGANTGGANGVYWVSLEAAAPGGDAAAPGAEERGGASRPASVVRVRNLPGRGKHRVAAVETDVEAELVFPLLRWADVARYRAVPGGHLLLPQDAASRRGIDEAAMRNRYPLAYAFLERFRPVLLARAAYRRYQSRGPYYSMYDVGPYTLAPIKVVWRRMDRRPSAAVVENYVDPRLGPRPVVPQETCVLVAADSADEAYYLCALLNSAVVAFLVRSHSVRGGKSFGTPGMLEFLRLARFDPKSPIHRELAAAGREAHRIVGQGASAEEVQPAIDRLAGRLWGLGPGELRRIEDEMEDRDTHSTKARKIESTKKESKGESRRASLRRL